MLNYPANRERKRQKGRMEGRREEGREKEKATLLHCSSDPEQVTNESWLSLSPVINY